MSGSALSLLVGRQEGQLACKKREPWGGGVVICLERGADLHMAQLMPLPLTVSCFSEIHIDFTFLVLAHPDSPGKRAIKHVCVCVRFGFHVRLTVQCVYVAVIEKLAARGYQPHLDDLLLRLNFSNYYKSSRQHRHH